MFNGPFSGTTQVSRYQKSKTNLHFTEARESEWQWHQLGHMQVCTLLQTDNHASMPPLSFLQAGSPSCCPTNSVKALKVLQLQLISIKSNLTIITTEIRNLTNSAQLCCCDWLNRTCDILCGLWRPRWRRLAWRAWEPSRSCSASSAPPCTCVYQTAPAPATATPPHAASPVSLPSAVARRSQDWQQRTAHEWQCSCRAVLPSENWSVAVTVIATELLALPT